MRILIDACVLFPTVLREIIMGAAARNLFTPLWSPRILEEWARATIKLGPHAEPIARMEIAQLRATWPQAEITPDTIPGLSLPDPDDTHVLAAAITGNADLILTLNLSDFPPRALAPHGLTALDPDRFLNRLAEDHPKAIAAIAETVRAEAERLSGQPQPLRALLKRATLPKLAKRLAA